MKLQLCMSMFIYTKHLRTVVMKRIGATAAW